MWALGLLEGTYCTMFASGIISSWTYLRFYQCHSNGTKGDMAENFTFARYKNRPKLIHHVGGMSARKIRDVFAMCERIFYFSFFPNVLQPPISVFANSVFQFFVKIGLCRKPVKRFVDSSGPSSISITLPGSDPNDAERRR